MLFKSNKFLADNETFIGLVQLMKEDEEVKTILESLINLPSMQRKSVVSGLIDDMMSKNAPEELLNAMEAFRDDEVVERIKIVLADKYGNL